MEMKNSLSIPGPGLMREVISTTCIKIRKGFKNTDLQANWRNGNSKWKLE
jgi:hypothetical protein